MAASGRAYFPVPPQVSTQMSKAMTIAGMVVAAVVFAVFVLDILAGVPFGTGMNAMHIGAIIASAILGYVSFSTFREQK